MKHSVKYLLKYLLLLNIKDIKFKTLNIYNNYKLKLILKTLWKIFKHLLKYYCLLILFLSFFLHHCYYNYHYIEGTWDSVYEEVHLSQNSSDTQSHENLKTEILGSRNQSTKAPEPERLAKTARVGQDRFAKG